MTTSVLIVRFDGLLLPERLPPAATRYARRRPIPFSRSGIAAELTVRICAADCNTDKTFPPDAAGNIRASGRNFTVRNGQHRTRRRFATAAFCHDGDIPEPVIGRLGGGGSGGEGDCGSEGGSKQYNTDAVVAHESKIPDLCEDAALVQGQCVQNLLRRVNTESSHRIKHLMSE
jgi:hypothetical protein